LIRSRLMSLELVDERLAVVAEQTDLHSVLVEERDWEPLDALPQHSAGYRSSVDLI